MGDATEEKYELNEDGPVDSQEPLTAGYNKVEYIKTEESGSEKHRIKDVRSFCLSVFNLMNAILGSGILGLADAMNNLGVVVFYVLLLLTAGLAGYTIDLLLVTSQASGQTSFEGMAVKAFGMTGKVATSVMIIFHCLGAMCSYIYIIKAELPLVMNVIFNHTTEVVTHGIQEHHADPDAPWYLQGTFLMIMAVVLVIVPLASMKDIRFLGYSSAFGMACMLLFTFTVVGKKSSIPCPLDEHQSNVSTGNYTPQVCSADLAKINKKSAYAVPTMMFAFMCHASMLPIYQELRRPSIKKMRKVAGVSIFLVLTLYLLSASFGYFTFYNYVQAELLLTYNSYNPGDPMIIVSRVMVLICVTLSTPLLHYPCRKTIISTFMPNPERFSWVRHLGVMIATLSVAVLLVIFIPNIRNIFGIAGATSSTSLLIVFPCAFFLRLTQSRKTGMAKRIVVMTLLVIGILFMIMSVSLIVLDWVTAAN